MLKLAGRPEDARAMGERNARLAVERFSLERQVDEFTRIYDGVRARRAGR
jgi:hypothetical protein